MSDNVVSRRRNKKKEKEKNEEEEELKYTSMKGLMGGSYKRMESWREIGIKEPVVQQAAWAWAYYTPTSNNPERSNFFRCFRDALTAIFNTCCFKHGGATVVDQHIIHDTLCC